jgi:legumain
MAGSPLPLPSPTCLLPCLCLPARLPPALPAPACPQDYSHTEVNAATFLAVLAGNASAAPLAGRHSSGRVIASGPTDKVFVYYADHGAPGILGMPSGPFLYADQLNAVVANKSAAGGFEEMVL